MLASSAEPLRWCAYSVNGYDRNVDLKPFAKMSLRGQGPSSERWLSEVRISPWCRFLRS
jgi:hypothetical protein